MNFHLIYAQLFLVAASLASPWDAITDILGSLFHPAAGSGVNLGGVINGGTSGADLPTCGMKFAGQGGSCCKDPGLASLCVTAGSDKASYSIKAAIDKAPISLNVNKIKPNMTVINNDGFVIASLGAFPTYTVLDVSVRNKTRGGSCSWESVVAVTPTPAPFDIERECSSPCRKNSTICIPYHFCTRTTPAGTMIFAILSKDTRYTYVFKEAAKRAEPVGWIVSFREDLCPNPSEDTPSEIFISSGKFSMGADPSMGKYRPYITDFICTAIPDLPRNFFLN